MSTRLRSTSLASAGAITLVLMFAGLAAGRVVLTEEAPAPEVTTPDTTVLDTTATFEDIDGNGIDDDCEEGEVADVPAAEAAALAIDENADGVISVSEAAHSGWIGGKNCNHGGYVSWVAHGSPAATTEVTSETAKAADKAAKEAAKAAAKAAREAAKAERAAARAAAKAERDAARAEAKAAKQHGKSKNH